MPKSLGAQPSLAAQPLSGAEQSTFLDESARVGGVDARPRITEDTTGVAGIPKTAQDAVVSTQDAIQNATINTTTVLSDTARAAGEQASQALQDAKKAAIDAGKKELTKAKDEVSSSFQNKFREGVGALGLGVIGKRGESAAETYEQEFEADDQDKPRQTTDSPGLLQTDADIRQLRGMFGHMGGEPGPRAFGNPWYS